MCNTAYAVPLAATYLLPSSLFNDVPCENSDYLTHQIITYIGNKRALLPFIEQGVNRVCTRLSKEQLRVFDVFSGSGVVARSLKSRASLLLVNDIEEYSAIINKCYLSNKSTLDIPLLQNIYRELLQYCDNDDELLSGIITNLYAPKCDSDIQVGERVFYTHRNAQYIDTMRAAIERVSDEYKPYFLAPLLYEASVHSNTSGVFKGFHKNKKTGVGQFGGTGEDALTRIKGRIELPFPIFSNYECEYNVYSGDSNTIIKSAPEVDLAYIDPPYNQHPYGSNYFMLNLITQNKAPLGISPVSGIPIDWNRSLYNKRQYAFNALTDLVKNIKASHVLISYNSEGFVKLDEMVAMLKRLGKLDVLETKYNTFRGCRNLRGRDIHVTEYLFLVEK